MSEIGQTIINQNILDVESLNKPIDLIITSPPYNLKIEYDSIDDGTDYQEYLEWMGRVAKKLWNFSSSDTRFCLNIPLDSSLNGVKPVFKDVLGVVMDQGWQYKTTIVWNEQNISSRTAWGSWKSASAPYVIAPVEMIAVLYKDQWKKLKGGESDISKESFIEWTNGHWTFNGESAKRVGHPAPFPVELPRRCIQLFSYVGDVVLDPFLGSGTTLVACRALNRQGIGVELSPKYCKLSENRINNEYMKYRGKWFDLFEIFDLEGSVDSEKTYKKKTNRPSKEEKNF